MPVHPCKSNGKKGFQWGNQKCYTGRGAKAKAKRQGHAITMSIAAAHGYKPKKRR